MDILVIGYGSMGRRRIRLIKKILKEKKVSFTCVDTNPDRLIQIEKDGNRAYSNIDDALVNRYDIAFICTSPGYHAEILLKVINSGIDVFTELNLVADRYDEIIANAKQKKVKVFMSNTLFYDKEISAIKDYFSENNSKMTYIYHVGQYLPDWHPWESYRDFFIGHKRTNGCREILAIQLPWMVDLFGDIKKISVIRKKNTSLEIDYEDTYIINIEHLNGNSGVFVCDVLARKAVNYLEIMTEEKHLFWNGTPESLSVYNTNKKQMEVLQTYNNFEHIEGYADIISENQYEDEIKAFFEYVYDNKKPKYTLEQDRKILEIINEIEA